MPPTQTQIVLLNRRTPSYRWRRIFLILHARDVLISIADNAKKRSLQALPAILSPPSQSYTALITHDDELARATLAPADVTIDVPDNHDHPQQPFSAGSLASIVKEKNLACLFEFGGIEGIAEALGTNLERGICSNPENIRRRQDAYGKNIIYCQALPAPATAKSFFNLLFKVSKDWTVLLLLCCGALSLGLGIEKEGLKDGWYDGASIFFTVFALVAITSLSNYCRARKLNKNKPRINVWRDGRSQRILISDVVVGDVVCLKTGDKVPADGLFFDGIPLQVNEVSDSRVLVREQSPFLLSESKVTDGSARMLVTSVGPYTVWGEMMKTVTHDPSKKTLLERRIDKLNSYVEYIGLFLAVLILVVLLLRYVLGKREDDETGHPDIKNKGTPIRDFVKIMKRLVIKPRGRGSILTSLLTVFLLGLQEELPFFICLALRCWKKRLSDDHVITQDLSAVTMGSVTTICTDKTGILALDKSEVDTFWFGEKVICEDVISSSLAPEVLEVLRDGVGTPLIVPGTSSFHTEDPLLLWSSKVNLGVNMKLLQKSCTILNQENLNSDRKPSGLLIRKNGGTEKTIHLHRKGAAQEILPMCSYYYNSKGVTKDMNQQKKWLFERIIEDMDKKGLQSIALAYQKIDKDDDDDAVVQEEDLILLGVVGLKSAMQDFRHAGVCLKLVSSEDLTQLRKTAIDCGILVHDQDSDAVVLKGEDFRKLSDKQREEMVDRICVMGSTLPSDKLLMVKCLQRKGHSVAFIGTMTTSDTPALKEADIGISLGTQCSEIARDHSDVIILNGNFASVATVFKSGICSYRNIQKFIQLELTMTIAGLLINTITTVSLGDAPITTLQLFWVNLTVGAAGALALLTETHKLKEVASIPQTELLITKAMWRNITAQALYQTIILIIFQFKGEAIPGMNQEVAKTMIFNIFVLCQAFNQFNSRDIEKKNVFMGILENHWFLVSVGASFIVQVMVVEFAENIAGTVKLNLEQWLACILTAIISCPIDSAAKCIPGFASNRSNGSLGSHIEFIGTTAPLITSVSLLELPLITSESQLESSTPNTPALSQLV